VSAEAYLVANLDSGAIYAEHNTSRVVPIASVTKLITALVATHELGPEWQVPITDESLKAYGEAGGLVAGEIYSVAEILYPLLLESSNDAAEAIAYSYGYDKFVAKMNDFATELGMTSTSFRDASGLSSGNVSTARDLLKLAQYLYRSESGLLTLTRKMNFAVASTTSHRQHTWNAFNPFTFDPEFLGGKTGRTTEAKESMVSLFRRVHRGLTYPFAIIVLRSDFSSRELDSSYLLSQIIQKIINGEL
jgi:D-alanyl-D-alanine carboxypeptidase